MNDRYLFRAKRIDNGEWVIGSLVWSDDADEEYKAIIIPPVNSNMFTEDSGYEDLGFENWYKVDPSTICRSTGLKDKNSKLIWENDVVKFDVYYYEKLQSSIISQIKWCNDLCSLSLVVNNRGTRGTLGHLMDSNKEIEVIGNIFDNPELYKREETYCKDGNDYER